MIKREIIKAHKYLYIPVTIFITLLAFVLPVQAAMTDYCFTPPYITAGVPPLVMLVMSKDHKDYYKAYNDYSDLDGDGTIETTYKQSISYYGYFDPTKCYSYSGGVFSPSTSGSSDPTATATCSGAWSGNFLNWATMSRIDAVRKVLYGGMRSTDTSGSTILERSFLPQDAHSWVKVYTPDGSSNQPSISQLTPYSQTSLSLCNTTKDAYSNPPLVRVAKGAWYRWASAERWQCAFKGEVSDGTHDIKPSGTTSESLRPSTTSDKLNDFNVRVSVCVSGMLGAEKCKQYGTNLKPVGLLQQYGESNKMYFGLMSGSWSEHVKGGVLRKNVSSITDEIDQTTGIVNNSVQGIIYTENNLKMRRYDYDNGYYNDTDNCPWGLTPAQFLSLDNRCTNWGNPMAEMFLETMRYFAGKTANSDYTAGTDDLAKAIWYDPYKDNGTNNLCKDSFGNLIKCPPCSKPFAMIISDTSTSFDADQLTTTDFSGLSWTAQTDTIGTDEGISGNVFIGNNGSTNDGLCTAKSFGSLSSLRGLCPTEPTRQGSFALAGLAYWAHMNDIRQGDTTVQKLNTYAVALSSPLPEITVNVGGSPVKLIPACRNQTNNTMCTLVQFRIVSQTANSGLFYVNWEDSEQGGDYDMDADGYLRYDVSGGTITLTAEVFGHSAGSSILQFGFNVSGTSSDGANWIAQNCSNQAYCGANSNRWFSCSVTNDSSPEANSNCIENSSGTPINGGTWNNFSSTAVKDYQNINQTRTWLKGSLALTTGGANATTLKDPLWYAAKYGGFKDSDSDGKPYTDSSCLTGSPSPGCAEWVTFPKQYPDNYFYVTNAMSLETQLTTALNQIIEGVSSGTVASILTSSGGSGANITQAVFYPKKIFDNHVQINWVGELQNLWYYLDPYLNNLSIREDTTQDDVLNLRNDRIAQFFYDPDAQRAKVHLWDDADGNGAADNPSSPTTIELDDLKSLWKAGYNLWKRSTPRTIYTTTTGNSLLLFDNTNKTALRTYLQAADNTNSGYLIDYVRGVDRNSPTPVPNYRNRTVSINGVGPYVWKLGDIMSATPKIASISPLDSYDKDSPTGYGDSTYSLFTKSSDYNNRGMVYVGANDGMLHAFNMGVLQETWSGQGSSEKARISGSNIGEEQWAFIPQNALPFLQYLADPNYCHLAYVDLSPTLVDVSITTPTYRNSNSASHVLCQPSNMPSCGSGTYDACPKQTCVNTSSNPSAVLSSSWETILIGGMGLGGGCKKPDDTCTSTDCVKAPAWDPVDNTKALGLSSYFALKVTDQNNPVLLWEFPRPNSSQTTGLGLSTSGPAIVRIGNKDNNGKWFAVFVSGPTGPISANQFRGTSNQNLKLFVLDLKTGELLRTIDTGIAKAFGGTLSNGASDPDRWNSSSSGYYQDDVVYIGFTKYNTSSTQWTDGGVLRLVTKESSNPADWVVSTVIDNVGPVTTAVAKLQDRTISGQGKFWLYFGTGRYFWKDPGGVDDASSIRAFYGVKDPCYDPVNNNYIASCTNAVSGSIIDQTTTIGSVDNTAAGWMITLSGTQTVSGIVYAAERVVSDPVTSPTGVVFFSTYKPTTDVCALGGNSYLWAVQYNTGGYPSLSSLQGEIMMQVSTGSIEERKLNSTFGPNTRVSLAIAGKGSSGFSVVTPGLPVRKFIHLKER